MAEKRPLPRFIQDYSKHVHNGMVREAHAPRSVFFQVCPEEQVSREFQLSTIFVDRGVSVYRCSICGVKIEKKNNNQE